MIERYEHSKHRALVERWFRQRHMAMPPAELLYDTGFVVDGVVVGFLKKTNSKSAEIDQVAIKPGLPSREREAALVALFSALEAEAKACGFWQVIAFPVAYSTMDRRFWLHGYTSHGIYSCMAKSLLDNGDELCLG